MSARRAKDPGTARRAVIIACTLRSGSNLLCERLERLGLGKPREYFQEDSYRNPVSVRSARLDAMPNVGEACARYLAEHQGRSWLGVKWNWLQFQTLKAALESDRTAPDFDALFPDACWIQLERGDKVAQAVSLVLARKTGVWVNGDPPAVARDTAYDFDEIHATLHAITAEELLWRRFFKEAGITPLKIQYEDLVAGAKAECEKVLRLTGVHEAAPDAWGQDDLLLNKPTTTGLHRSYAEQFYADLANGRRPGSQDVDALLRDVNQLYERQGAQEVFRTFMGDHVGSYPRIRKLNIGTECRIVGPVEKVEASHFLDRVAYRLDPGSRVEIAVDARRILVQLLMHPWSGEAKVTVDGKSEVLDLFHPVTTTKPVVESWDECGPHRVTIRPVGRANALSEGVETWLQQVWTLAD